MRPCGGLQGAPGRPFPPEEGGVRVDMRCTAVTSLAQAGGSAVHLWLMTGAEALFVNGKGYKEWTHISMIMLGSQARS